MVSIFLLVFEEDHLAFALTEIASSKYLLDYLGKGKRNIFNGVDLAHLTILVLLVKWSIRVAVYIPTATRIPCSDLMVVKSLLSGLLTS